MRIVYLANSAWPSLRGAERLMFALAEHARVRGDEVTVIAPGVSAIHAACTVRGTPCEAASFRASLGDTARLRALLREIRPDIVHGMSIFPVAYVRELGLVPDEDKVAFFAEATIDPTSLLPVSTPGPKRLGLFVRNAISRFEAPKLDAIFVPSTAVREGLERVGIRSRVLINSGMIVPEALAAAAATPFDYPADGFRIGYAGFLERLKGIDVLIRAFAAIAGDHPEAELFVAGRGGELDSLVELAGSLGVGERVHMLGFVDPVAAFTGGLDLFVSASRSESLGRSVLEAMALGVPVVSTISGGQADYITHEKTGLAVAPDDVEGLASAIQRMIEDDALRGSLAAAGKAVATAAPFLESAAVETVFATYAATLDARENG
ncbi:MAG TPA: glycosyltransferase family 4 protein [Coriobacteriia bacterium]|nr:glycosyltransferase family 4 protein [Coriobacteriia bacterium]